MSDFQKPTEVEVGQRRATGRKHPFDIADVIVITAVNGSCVRYDYEGADKGMQRHIDTVAALPVLGPSPEPVRPVPWEVGQRRRGPIFADHNAGSEGSRQLRDNEPYKLTRKLSGGAWETDMWLVNESWPSVLVDTPEPVAPQPLSFAGPAQEAFFKSREAWAPPTASRVAGPVLGPCKWTGTTTLRDGTPFKMSCAETVTHARSPFCEHHIAAEMRKRDSEKRPQGASPKFFHQSHSLLAGGIWSLREQK